jgi:hypothetical protein
LLGHVFVYHPEIIIFQLETSDPVNQLIEQTRHNFQEFVTVSHNFVERGVLLLTLVYLVDDKVEEQADVKHLRDGQEGAHQTLLLANKFLIVDDEHSFFDDRAEKFENVYVGGDSAK